MRRTACRRSGPVCLGADSQFDGIDGESLGKIVDRALKREGANRLAGRAHERVGAIMSMSATCCAILKLAAE
jgi:hypothetical protein